MDDKRTPRTPEVPGAHGAFTQRYPGLGLGTIVAGASKVTSGMLLAAAEPVAGQAGVGEPGASLLPEVENRRASSAATAVAVARAAAADGVATRQPGNWVQAVQDAMWQPVYDGRGEW
jgi:malate dehydrogenase (oxaloacetate-decarboxylating)